MRIEWSEPSISDLVAIKDHIATDSRFYAARFIEKIIKSVEKLVDHPLIGRLVPEADDEAVRELIFQSYRIIYSVESERVLILTVLHGSRDMSGMAPKPWEIR